MGAYFNIFISQSEGRIFSIEIWMMVYYILRLQSKNMKLSSLW